MSKTVTREYETIKKRLDLEVPDATCLEYFPFFKFFSECDQLSDSEFEEIWTDKLNQLDFLSVPKITLSIIVRKIYLFSEHWKERIEYWKEDSCFTDPNNINYRPGMLESSKIRYHRSLWLFNTITTTYITDNMRLF